MGKTKNIIEINGKKYDATTGAVLSHATQTPAPTKKARADHAVSKPSMHDVVHRKPAKHAAAHAPIQTQTLMRRAVKKPPTPTHTQQTKATKHANSLARRTLAQVSVNPSVRRLNEQRLKHAQNVAKSRLVSHFSPTTEIGFGQPIAVPTALPAQPIKPVAHTKNTHKSAPTTADMLALALQHATSHEQPAPTHLKPKRQKHGHKLGIIAAAGASLVFVAVVSSQGLPGLRMHMATAKAGFSASLPDYKPAGYSLGQLNYSQGEIATSFQSNSNDNSYTLVQKPSTLTSDELRQNIVAPADPHYRIEQTGGRTLFIYGKGTVSWVNAGILYQLQSDGTLSDRQLIQIALSL